MKTRPTEAAPLALTCGDPAGIGLDITIGAWLARHEEGIPPFVLIGDSNSLGARIGALGRAIAYKRVDDPADVPAVFADAIPVFNVTEPLQAPVVAGQPDQANAAHVIGSIREAVELATSGAARAVVTNPVAKHVLYGVEFDYPGQTEFLAALAGPLSANPGAPAPRPLMLLWSEALAVVPLSTHIPITEVPARVTKTALRETLLILDAAMRRDFGIAEPRIAVAGLNPHAGEEGTIGREDIDIIAPTLAALQSDGLKVTGPHSADTLFHDRAREAYDVAVTMYHDQALIPIKTLAFDTGVNTTLGLPFVRTSPDHGTAFALAGTGRASPSSLIAALKLADRIADTRGGARG